MYKELLQINKEKTNKEPKWPITYQKVSTSLGMFNTKNNEILLYTYEIFEKLNPVTILKAGEDTEKLLYAHTLLVGV